MQSGDTFQSLAQAFLENRIDRRDLVKGLAAIGITIPAAGAGFAATSRVAAAQEAARGNPGGAVVVGVYQEPNSLNFLLTGGPISFASMQLTPLFEPLIRYNAEGIMEPRLLTEIPSVENGGVSEDGLTYTLKFTPGRHLARRHALHGQRFPLHLGMDHGSGKPGAGDRGLGRDRERRRAGRSHCRGDPESGCTSPGSARRSVGIRSCRSTFRARPRPRSSAAPRSGTDRSSSSSGCRATTSPTSDTRSTSGRRRRCSIA